jgi:hypothetical protein
MVHEVFYRIAALAYRELLFSAFSGEALSVRQSRIRVGLAQVSYSFSFFSIFYYFVLKEI